MGPSRKRPSGSEGGYRASALVHPHDRASADREISLREVALEGRNLISADSYRRASFRKSVLITAVTPPVSFPVQEHTPKEQEQQYSKDDANDRSDRETRSLAIFAASTAIRSLITWVSCDLLRISVKRVYRRASCKALGKISESASDILVTVMEEPTAVVVVVPSLTTVVMELAPPLLPFPLSPEEEAVPRSSVVPPSTTKFPRTRGVRLVPPW